MSERIAASNPLKPRIGLAAPAKASALELRRLRNKPLADRIGGKAKGSKKSGAGKT